jgi:hypothetical protein
LYSDAGLNGLWEGENAEIAGMERILEHWRDLDYREPTLKIICPHDYSRKRFGLFVDGCPNLLWELMRTRREQLTASQLMRKNPTEAIVDKDNHLRDALKYILFCHNALHAFVWEEGGPALDLHTLIPPGSGMQLTNAFNINDRGEILAKAAPLGFTPNDDQDLGALTRSPSAVVAIPGSMTT